PAVIGSYSTVDTGAKVSNSVVWDHADLGENCRLRGSIVCRSVTLKNGSLLEEGTVIGSEVVVGQGATINPNVRIWPNKEIEAGAVVRESVIWAGSWRRGLFSAYGLTGLSNVEFTPEFASRLGATVGALYPKGAQLAVSRDYTRSARMIHRAMVSGMISSGANVTDLHALPAPVARHWARQHRMPAVHAQSSPVDPRSADIRIFDSNGLDLSSRDERKLENLFFREDIRRVFPYEMGRIVARESEFERYTDDLIGRIDLEVVRSARFKVLVDYNNGASAQVLPRVLGEMNCGVIPLNASPAEVVAEQTDPEFRAHLQEMAVIVKAVNAKLGVFIDSPGERCFLIDETGEVLEHDVAFAVLAQLALAARPGILMGPASSSIALAMIADRLKSRFVPTKTTPGSVLRAAQHTETVLASDGGGGYCWPEFQVAFDAIYTTARALELMAATGSGLAVQRTQIPKVGYFRQDVFCPWEAKGRVMRTVMERHLKDRVDLTDGVKVFVDDGWVLVVPDADRPEYHIIASTDDPTRARGLVEEYVGIVRSTVAEAAPEVEGVTERE
ncbi:MAG TPA: hypothetical protein VK131_14230, partial [Candidatus Acidoferrales bacterium]|nr:hypothetical protein [Candidatus Acidoferrales bacterium]